MSNTALARLAQERKDFRKQRPYGFVGKPQTRSDGSVNLLVWNCCVPGKAKTIWEQGSYPVKLVFSEGYPSQAPKAYFPAGFLHRNVYDNGMVCLSILNDDPDMCGAWAPSLTVLQVLLGIQELLDEPNMSSAAQELAFKLFKNQPDKYKAEVRKQARKYPSQEERD